MVAPDNKDDRKFNNSPTPSEGSNESELSDASTVVNEGLRRLSESSMVSFDDIPGLTIGKTDGQSFQIQGQAVEMFGSTREQVHDFLDRESLNNGMTMVVKSPLDTVVAEVKIPAKIIKYGNYVADIRMHGQETTTRIEINSREQLFNQIAGHVLAHYNPKIQVVSGHMGMDRWSRDVPKLTDLSHVGESGVYNEGLLDKLSQGAEHYNESGKISKDHHISKDHYASIANKMGLMTVPTYSKPRNENIHELSTRLAQSMSHLLNNKTIDESAPHEITIDNKEVGHYMSGKKGDQFEMKVMLNPEMGGAATTFTAPNRSQAIAKAHNYICTTFKDICERKPIASITEQRKNTDGPKEP